VKIAVILFLIIGRASTVLKQPILPGRIGMIILFIVTAVTNNPKIRVYASKNAQDDREVYIDEVSIFVYEEVDNDPPSAPSNLVSAGLTTSSVTLSWSGSSDNIGVAGYKIYTK
jgi:hypothetical protein